MTVDGWLPGTLGALASINECVWDPSEGTEIKYLDLTAVTAPGRLAPPRLVQASEAPSRARRRIRSGDILVSTVRPHLRGFARVTETSENLVASTGFAVLTPREDADPSFLYHHVMSSRFVRFLEPRMTGSGYPAVRSDDVAAYPVMIPPLAEQHAIATILDSIDEAIERTEAVIAATTQLREALIHDLLTRGLPGRHSEWKHVSGAGRIPACWRTDRLGDYAAHITSGSRGWSRYYRPTGALFVRSQNIVNGAVDRTDAVYVQAPNDSEARRTRIRPGDLLISITGNPGQVAVATASIGEAYVSQHVALVRLRQPNSTTFLARFLQGPGGQAQFRRSAYGQTRPGLNLVNIRDLTMAVPEDEEREQIVGVLNAAEEASHRALESRKLLEDLKRSAADALLTGRVRAQIVAEVSS